MRLTDTSQSTDRLIEKLVASLASDTPGFEDGADGFRDHVAELAREALDGAVVSFEPESLAEWLDAGELSEGADRDRERVVGL